MQTIILASGGTGGHIFPAKALAGELARRQYKVILITDDRYQQYDRAGADFEVSVIRSSSVSGGVINKIESLFGIAIGYFQARRILKKHQPAVVIGFGGYPSFPTMYAASRLKLKTIIHEQNSMLGRANYVLSNRMDLIATSFENVTGVLSDDIYKVRFTGNPVRDSVRVIRDIQYPDITENGMLRIFVTGGSQGASVFSKIVPQAIGLLSDEFKVRIRIDQQCREATIDDVRSQYKELGVSADLATFFHDVPIRLASAHLVIARSGASTLAEIEVAGRPVIMVPYPHAMDDHQTLNANALEEVGGGWVMPEDIFTAQGLAQKLESFLNLPSILQEAAQSSWRVGCPDADKRLADLVDEMAQSSVDQLVDEPVEEIEDEGLSKLDEIEVKNS